MKIDPSDPAAPDHIRAHKHCAKHREEILKSAECGCFYCIRVFPPTDIQVWVDGDTTALCSRCGIDSVIGSAASFPIDPNFLGRMHEYWFRPADDSFFRK